MVRAHPVSRPAARTCRKPSARISLEAAVPTAADSPQFGPSVHSPSHPLPTKPADLEEAPVRAFRDAADFECWLEKHAGLRAGVWLKLAKKGSGVPSLTDDEAVDVGLCYGWISGQRKSCDTVYYLQKYVPRRVRSRWSQVNVAKVEALIAAGRMRPSGLAEVEAARADGRWAAAYEPQRNATVPPDLAAALEASHPAAQAFDALSKTQRYAVILKLVNARTTTARATQLRRAMTALEAQHAKPSEAPHRDLQVSTIEFGSFSINEAVDRM